MSLGNDIAVVVFMLLILAAVIVLFVFYLINLQNVLKEIEAKNQLVPPGNVWLMFIPLFNIIYPFILYPKICDSIKLEMEDRGHGESGDYSRGIGIAMPVLGLASMLPVLGGLASLGNLILFIIFWVKMAEYKNKLRTIPKGNNVGLNMKTDLLD